LPGLWIRKLKEKRKKNPRWKTAIVNLTRAHSAPFVSYLFSFADDSPLKKGKVVLLNVADAYGRLLSMSTMTAPTTAIATIMPITDGKKYCSAIVGGAVGCGVGVAGASTMLKVVSSFDGQ
jgi:hypothetical protein